VVQDHGAGVLGPPDAVELVVVALHNVNTQREQMATPKLPVSPRVTTAPPCSSPLVISHQATKPKAPPPKKKNTHT
jgi:hypothetical protein